MHSVTVRKSVSGDWRCLFDLVLDIERYPQFVPCCTRDRILARKTNPDGSIEIVSRMTVGLQPIQVSYTNRTIADPAARRIIVDSADGPLRHLHLVWRFEPRGDGQTEIALAASYAFRSPLLTSVAAGLFDRLFGQMIDAFENRAASQVASHAARNLAGGHAAPGPAN